MRMAISDLYTYVIGVNYSTVLEVNVVRLEVTGSGQGLQRSTGRPRANERGVERGRDK